MMTDRAEFAKAALTGLLAQNHTTVPKDVVVREAVEYADELIQELSKAEQKS